MDANSPPPTPDLGAPENFIQRELSLIDFQKRVLGQSMDPTTPLLERIRFLVITATNLDEFFEIRVSGLKQRIRYGATSTDESGKRKSGSSACPKPPSGFWNFASSASTSSAEPPAKWKLQRACSNGRACVVRNVIACV